MYISCPYTVLLYWYTGATSGAETAYTSGAPEFTTSFSGVRVDLSFVFCVEFSGADPGFQVRGGGGRT